MRLNWWLLGGCLLAGPLLPAQDPIDQGIGLAVDARYEEALLIFKGQLARDPDNPLKLYYVAITEFKLQRFALARTHFERSLAKGADFPQAYYWLARTHQELEELEPALSILAEGLKHFPRNEDLASLRELLLSGG